jgi:antitoxin component YwqK of YwqJK toxin-antitoxin module
MRKYFATLAILLVGSQLFAQNLTLGDLIGLSKKSTWEAVDGFLKKKKWTYSETSNADQGKIVVWSLQKEKDANKASAWLMLTLLDGKPAKLTYEFGNPTTIAGMKKATKVLKLKEVGSESRADGATVTYKNPSSCIVLSTFTGKQSQRLSKSPSTFYSVDIFQLFGAYDMVNGVKRESYPNGSIKSECTLKNGKPEGVMKQFYPNGKLCITTTYLAGVKNGPETEYESDGALKIERSYQNGIVNGEVKLYANGKLSSVGAYVNGKKDGAFVDYTPEGGILAKYNMKSDSLHGRYIKNIYDGAAIKYTITGDYDNGLRNGYWETASIANGEKVVFGYCSYLLGVKDGKFCEQQGDSLMVGSYKAGRLEGRLDVYSFSSADMAAGTPDVAKAKQTVSYTYSNGMQNGLYERRDASGMVVAKGNMMNGNRDGEWMLVGSEPDEQGKPSTVFRKGSFLRNIEVGEWTVSTVDNVVIKRYNHKNGRVEGRIVEYNWGGKPLRELQIESGRLVKLSLYDSLGKVINRTIDVVGNTDRELRCRMETVTEKGTTTCGYWLSKVSCGDITSEGFEKIFLANAVNSRDTTKGGADGDVKMLGKDNALLLEGRYSRNTKVGKWKSYFYQADLMMVVDYSAKVAPVENYLDLPTGKPFTGHFIDTYDSGQRLCDFSIYSGLRDGKSKYYDRDGKMVKEETYARGILKR